MIKFIIDILQHVKSHFCFIEEKMSRKLFVS